MGYHRKLERRPKIEDVQEYGLVWEAWHAELRSKPGYKEMVKGGGNGIFMLILAFRWWVDTVDELEEGNEKEEAANRIEQAIQELNASLTGILRSEALEQATRENEDVEEEMGPKKK